MRNILLATILLLSSLALQGQFRWDWGIHAGASNYLGDIGGKDQPRRDFIQDVRLNRTRYVFGAHIRYKINRTFSATAMGSFGRVQGWDEETIYAPRRARNLNFRNNLIEFGLRGEVTLYSDNDLGGRGYYNPDFKVFGFLGVAGLHHNPQGFLTNPSGDLEQGWYDLRELRTEGQDEEYGALTVAIPMGFGVYFTHNKKYRFGWELGYRITFTDYLDDISGTYAPENELDSELAIALANQTTTEVVEEAFGDAGMIYNYDYPTGYDGSYRNPRGINNYNDGYIYSTFSFGMVINERSRYSRAKYNWFNGRKRRKKTRAKF
jgi:hypothetical protein